MSAHFAPLHPSPFTPFSPFHGDEGAVRSLGNGAVRPFSVKQLSSANCSGVSSHLKNVIEIYCYLQNENGDLI